METITISVPFSRRHIHPELKSRGARYDGATKTWSLPSTDENRALAEEIQRPIAAPTHEERVRNVLNVCIEMLNGLNGPGKRRYSVFEVGDKIVIDSQSLTQEKP